MPIVRASFAPPFRPMRSSLGFAVAAALAAMQCVALANPTGSKVIAGSAAIQASGNTLTVKQSTDRAIINWQGFSIGKGELTKFVQPGAGSAVLNRVVSGNPSALLGRLEANGKVFLINPNGILVGGGAVINTNSFLASTLDLSNTEFMAGGDLRFMGSSTAGITNLGSIRADGGDVYLIAHTVENAGVLDAPKGTVGLAAGTDVLLKHAGDERLFVRTGVGAAGSADKGVDNSGVIAAVQAELRAAGGHVYALAVNNSGAIHATGIVEKDGRVLLTSGGGNIANAGSLTARNANGNGGSVRIAGGAGALVTNAGAIDVSGRAPDALGGAVTVTGERVALTVAARIDASGDAGGGTVLIGGDYQGKNPAVENAGRTLVGSDVRIAADAVSQGDGGRVIVWADESTVYNGHISARGGAGGGNGGFAEVSGKASLSFNGTVDLAAPAGALGTLLLDPKNARVQAAGTAMPGEVDQFNDTPDQDRSINPAVLAATNANVVIQANNDIFFDSALQLVQPGASITAQAGRNIQIDGAVIVGTVGGAISLTANESIGVDATQRDSGAGVIVMQAGSSINSGGGNILLHLKPTPDALNTAQFITVGTINAGAGTITLRNDGAAGNPANGAIAQAGNGLTGARLDITAPGQIILANPGNSVGTLLLSNDRFLLYTNAGALTVGEAGARGPRIADQNVTIQTLAGDLTVNAPAVPVGTPSGTLTYDSGGALTVNQVSSSFFAQPADMVFRAGGNATFTAPDIRARNVTVNAGGAVAFDLPGGGGRFGLTASDPAPNGMVTLTAGSGISSTASSTISAGTLNATSAGGRIDLHGNVNAVRLNASAPGGIAVDHPSATAIFVVGDVSSAGDISLNNFPAFSWSVGGIVRSTADAGQVTINTGTNVQFTPGPANTPAANARIETGMNGAIVFNAGTGQILDGTTPSFVGGSLFVSGRALGGGTSNPLDTQVSRLSANATRSGNFGGFAFFNNNANATGDLAIGGLDPTVFGILADGTTSGGEAINLQNNGSIVLDSGGVFGRNASSTGGSVVVNAMGAASDVISSAGLFGEGIVADTSLTVTAGRDIAVGRNTGIGDLVGRGGVDVNAGRSVFVEGTGKITGHANTNVFVTAADSIIMRPVTSGGSVIRSLGSGLVRITADTIDLDNGLTSAPVLSTNPTGTAGSILVFANNMNLAKRVDAGLGNVTFTSRTASRPIMVGAEDPAFLSFTDAELDRVTATRLSIGTPTASGGIVVQGPVSRPPVDPTYATLALRTGGNIDLISTIVMGSGGGLQLEGRNLQGAGNVTTNGAIFTSTGNISLSGAISAAELIMRAPAGNITMTGDNDIGTLGEVRYDREFRLRDVVAGLVSNNFVDGGGVSKGGIEVRNGNLVLSPGTQIIFGGSGNSFQLFSDSSVLNNAGSGAIVAETNARWLIYAPTQDAVRLGGLTPDFVVQGVQFPNEPPVAGNAIVLPTTSSGSSGSGGGTGTGGSSTGSSTGSGSGIGTGTGSGSGASAGTGSGNGTTSTGSSGTSNSSRGSFPEGARDIIITRYVPPPPVVAARPPVASLPEFVPQLPRMFRTVGEISVVDSLINRARALPDVSIDTMDDASFDELFALMDEINTLMNDELDAALTKLENLEVGGALDSRIATLQRQLSLFNTSVDRFADGQITLASQPRQISKFVRIGGPTYQLNVMLENIKELESAYDKQVQQIAERERARVERERKRAVDRMVNQTLTDARNFAGGPIVADDKGRPIIIPGGSFLPRIPPREIAPGVFETDTIFASLAAYEKAGYSLGKPVTNLNALVAAGGGNLSFQEVSRIVAAGGGNFTPGVVAALVAAGGGNLSSQQINALVAAGGGNLSNPLTLNSIVNATLVAAGAGNVLAVGVNNMVAAGGMNLVGQDGGSLVAAGGLNLVAAGGLNLVAAGGLNLIGNDGSTLIGNDGSTLVAAGGLNFTSNVISGMVAAGGLNLTPQAVSSMVAAGGLNLIGMDGSTLVAAGGGNLIGLDGGSLVAAGGMNMVSSVGAGLVAAGGGNISVERAAGLVAAGAGNFNQTFGNLVAAGGGNLAAMQASLVAAGGGNLVAAGGGNVISHNGGVLQGFSAGSNFVQSGGSAGALPAAGFNPAANFQNFRPQ